MDYKKFSYLTHKGLGEVVELQVCQSGAGWYIGAMGENSEPLSRDSEYFSSKEEAEEALRSGNWNQRLHP